MRVVTAAVDRMDVALRDSAALVAVVALVEREADSPGVSVSLRR